VLVGPSGCGKTTSLRILPARACERVVDRSKHVLLGALGRIVPKLERIGVERVGQQNTRPREIAHRRLLTAKRRRLFDRRNQRPATSAPSNDHRSAAEVPRMNDAALDRSRVRMLRPTPRNRLARIHQQSRTASHHGAIPNSASPTRLTQAKATSSRSGERRRYRRLKRPRSSPDRVLHPTGCVYSVRPAAGPVR
jgi:hypothetical protein